MSSEERSATELLAAALVVAFPDFVLGKLATLGVNPRGEICDAAEQGCINLGVALHELAGMPMSEHSRSPLELVRVATQPLSMALAEANVEAPPRDEHAARMHPEDIYDLYPASSQEFGEEVWRLHVQWGLEKARVIAGMVPASADVGAAAVPAPQPGVALFGISRERRDSISGVITQLGYETLVWRNPAALDDGLGRSPTLALVDLAHPGAHDAIRALVAAAVPVVAVGAHVDDLVAPGIMALGAQDVIGLDRLLDRLPGLLPRIV